MTSSMVLRQAEIYRLYGCETTAGNKHFVEKINCPRFLSGSSSLAAGCPCECSQEGWGLNHSHESESAAKNSGYNRVGD